MICLLLWLEFSWLINDKSPNHIEATADKLFEFVSLNSNALIFYHPLHSKDYIFCIIIRNDAQLFCKP